MTLLTTLYTSRGIVFAADSAITIDRGHGPTRLPKQEKFLSTRRLGLNGGVVGYFGLARVATEDMDKWLRRELDRWNGSRFAADLGDHLSNALNSAVPRSVRTRNPSGFHIGAFEERDGVAVPVMRYVSNIYGFDAHTGNYSDFNEYRSEEHFPSHPDPTVTWESVAPSLMKYELRKWELAHGLPYWFRNGQLAFSARAWRGLTQAIGDITTTLSESGYRVPDDLDKWEMLADALV